MGDGTKENPYTREDVLNLIEENGGKAVGLDLSGKVFEEGINLSHLDLKGLYLLGAHLEKAHFSGTHLENSFLHDAYLQVAQLPNVHLGGADLTDAHLDGAHLMNASLIGTDLRKAHLEKAYLEGANLLGAQLEGTFLLNTEFPDNISLEHVNWGNFELGEYRQGNFWDSREIYRRLKKWYTEHGIYNIAGRFFYCEMEANRKSLNWKEHKALKIWNWILMMLCGYGESWKKVIFSASFLFILFTFIYLFLNHVWTLADFGRSLYFSAVSFTALGYGSWTNTWFSSNIDWIRGLGAAESFLGVFMMALFLVTFTRKMTR